MSFVFYIQAGCSILICAIAAWTDFRTGRIPNPLNLAGMLLGLTFWSAVSGWQGLLNSVTGGLIVSLVPLILFKMNAMGGGDLKLFAALGSVLGAELGLEAQMGAFLFGGAQGIVVWISRGQLKSGLSQSISLLIPKPLRLRSDAGSAGACKTEIRFGPSIFVGTVAACLLRIVG